MCGCLCVGGVNRIIWLPFGCAMQQPAPSNTSHVKPITYHSLFRPSLTTLCFAMPCSLMSFDPLMLAVHRPCLERLLVGWVVAVGGGQCSGGHAAVAEASTT